MMNLLFEDTATAIRVHGFYEIVFAEDLNAYKAFERTAGNHEIVWNLKKYKHKVHTWSKATQINFDATKKSMHILAFSFAERAFRLRAVDKRRGGEN